MRQFRQNALFRVDVVHLFRVDDTANGHNLEGVVVLRVLLFHKHYAAERPRSCK